MLFRDASFRTPTDRPELDTLRALWPTAATPATFAPPLEVREDDDTFQILFDAGGRTKEDLEVEVEGQTLFVLGEALPSKVWGPSRARRAITLPAGVDASKAWMQLESRVLTVCLAKSDAGRRRAIIVRAE